MNQLNYKKTFSKLSHIKALSHDQQFDKIIQNLILHALNHENHKAKNERDVAKLINKIYGISIRTHVILSNIDQLRNLSNIHKDPKTKEFYIDSVAATKINTRLEKSEQLEKEVKQKWFEEIKIFINGITLDELEKSWNCLECYLCNVFEQHGIQTLQILNPNVKNTDEDQENLISIIDNILVDNQYPFSREILISSINQFITNADEIRANYISQLADSSFTSFALTSDAETVKFLNKRYNNLELFLDTNFIFGILDLHKNNEDASALEILDEVKKNNLPFRLLYHPETLAEFKRAFDARALYLKSSSWTLESSRVAIAVDGLSPIEELFHSQNIEQGIDPVVFLEKYDHVEHILKDLGLNEYIPMQYNDDELYEMEQAINKYQNFYENVPNRKPKSYLGFKHDIVVLGEVRDLNPIKTKFLESKAFFISSDFVLAKFEKHHIKRNWEINYVVNPSVFLQLIRPFIENDFSSNKRFIDTFSIPDFRAFDIDYTTTRSKTLQILNDNYHSTSFETKVKILRDQVLLDKLEKVKENNQKQIEIIESQIAIENQLLKAENIQIEESKNIIASENEKLLEEKEKIEIELKAIKQEKEELKKTKEIEIQKTSEIEELKQDIKSLKDILNEEKTKNKYNEDISEWKNRKSEYIDEKRSEKRTQFVKASRYCIRPTITLLVVSILTPITIRFYSEIEAFLISKQLSENILIIVIIFLIVLAAFGLLYRTYFANKDRIKMGLQWMLTFGLKSKKNKLINVFEKEIIKTFELEDKKPKLKI